MLQYHLLGTRYLVPIFQRADGISMAECVGRRNTVDANAGGFEETVRGR